MKIFFLLFPFYFFPAFGAELQGVVKNAAGKPIADVYVWLEPGEKTAISQHNGQFKFKGLRSGAYFLEFNHISYQPLRIGPIVVTDSLLVLNPIILKENLHAQQPLVVTATRIQTPLPLLPMAVDRLDREQLMNTLANTSAGALKNEPGVFIQKTSHGGGSAIIRGLSSSRILILLDGIRLNNSLYRTGNHQYLNTVDLFSLQAVEIVYGPASVQYGSDALGGVINLISRDFSDTAAGYGVGIIGRFASADRSSMFHGQARWQGKTIALQAGYSYKDFGDLRYGQEKLPDALRNSFPGTVQKPTAYLARDYQFKLQWKATSFTNLVFAWQKSLQTHVPRFDKYAYNQYNRWLYHPQARSLFYTRLVQKTNHPLLNEISATFSYQVQQEGREIQKEAITSLTIENDQATTKGITLQINGGYASHKISYGVDFYHDLIGSSRWVYDSLTDRKEKKTIARYPDGAVYQSLGIFVQDKFTVSERLSILWGGRCARHATEFALNDSLFGDQRLTFKALTFNAGLNYRFSQALHGYVNIGQGFRAPNLSDLSKFGQSKGQIIEIPNPDLKPERLISYMAGLKFRTSHTRFTMNGYYNLISGLIESAPDIYQASDVLIIDGYSYEVRSKQNIGRGYIYGMELALQRQVIDRWTAGFQLTYTRGQNQTRNEPIGGIPPPFAKFFVRYELAALMLEMNLKAAQRQTRLSEDDRQDPRIPAEGTPAWNTVNFQLQRKVGKWLQVQVAIENIFDVGYRIHGSGVNAPGRNFIFSLRLIQFAF
ncbi:outer membrane insertion C-terminal signal protein [Caldithrix abyssi DSM 13497]|uniref:Hemoglobin/transferrin/lactoferrin receptor protein n=1 Tax=Caldithrix abyssi DSM 13497 TaxID=880073 RepID=H1XT47_CALAY|nr:TonB-dependent receptor [Caldithrix abyssi]APF18626.1 hemoglobin/transferrin/lactoferrin receptor protein [Caldithrix abyssi DSM 13497]EHO42614.1 outer membrane insertion C-terminal signal protein [Caldithrix abyssi DSM 13497]